MLPSSAQRHVQVGREVPDVDIVLLGKAYDVTQELVRSRAISAGHDISDGGIITTLLEMAFSGDCGLKARKQPFQPPASTATLLFLLQNIVLCCHDCRTCKPVGPEHLPAGLWAVSLLMSIDPVAASSLLYSLLVSVSHVAASTLLYSLLATWGSCHACTPYHIIADRLAPDP